MDLNIIPVFSQAKFFQTPFLTLLKNNQDDGVRHRYDFRTWRDDYRHLVVRVLQETKPITHRGTGVVHRRQLLHEGQFVDQHALVTHLGQ